MTDLVICNRVRDCPREAIWHVCAHAMPHVSDGDECYNTKCALGEVDWLEDVECVPWVAVVAEQLVCPHCGKPIAVELRPGRAETKEDECLQRAIANTSS